MSSSSKYLFGTSLTLGAAMLTLCLASCGGSGGDSGGSSSTEGLTKKQDEGLAAIPPAPAKPLSEILLADGSSLQDVVNKFGLAPIVLDPLRTAGSPDSREVTPQAPNEFKRRFLERMIETGLALAQARDLPGEPTQTKLAYVYGSRDYTQRKSSKQLGKGPCTEELYGLDCSGLLMVSAAGGGVSVSGTAASLGLAKTWNNSSVLKSWRLEMKDVTAEGTYEAGDIVSWGSHIGIMRDSANIIQSNGSDGLPGHKPCSVNNDGTRGPSVKALADVRSWFPNKPTVLRLSTGNNLDGTWSGPVTIPASGNCSAVSGTFYYTFVDKNGSDGGDFTAQFYSPDIPPAAGNVYPFIFTGKRTKNSFVLTAAGGGYTLIGTLKEDVIDVQVSTVCGDLQSILTYTLKRNEKGKARADQMAVAASRECSAVGLPRR